MNFKPEFTFDTVALIVAILGFAWKMGRMSNKIDLMFGWFENNVINAKAKTRATHGD